MHVFVDANIFIRVATQGRPGCERERFDELRLLVEEHAFTLLVPEVVHLEVIKEFRSLTQIMESNCDKLNNDINKATKGIWSEIDSLRSNIQSVIKDWKQKRIAECHEFSNLIGEFLQSEFVTKIPLTPEIMVAAKRRQILGKMPNCKKSSDQDALIVETLASYFSQQNTNSLLLFCTENTSDFALAENPGKEDCRHVLHPDIQETLPTCQFSTSLESLLSITTGFEQFPDPTNDEIKAAAAYRDMHEDVDDDQFVAVHQSLKEAINKECVRLFCDKVQPLLPNELKLLRTSFANEIQQLLAHCRHCQSWSDRSEDKLAGWIEYVDEAMIPYTSLPRKLRLKRSLQRLFLIHQDMGDNEFAAGNEQLRYNMASASWMRSR